MKFCSISPNSVQFCGFDGPSKIQNNSFNSVSDELIKGIERNLAPSSSILLHFVILMIKSKIQNNPFQRFNSVSDKLISSNCERNLAPSTLILTNFVALMIRQMNNVCLDLLHSKMLSILWSLNA